jgi:hypothetical protein
LASPDVRLRELCIGRLVQSMPVHWFELTRCRWLSIRRRIRRFVVILTVGGVPERLMIAIIGS